MRRPIQAMLIALAIFTLAAASSSAAPGTQVYRVYNCELDLAGGFYTCPAGVTVVEREEGSDRVVGTLVLSSGDPVERVTIFDLEIDDVADLGPMSCRIVVRPNGTATGRCSN